ncbi:hypothetical protein [Aquamicrobium terrae]|uniref:DUF1127 domain-containing protein n=1 Tax=Aquamicrobium terrae TaxID=1324945 RepID=A0ABV2MTE2_9HYPH
MLALPFITRTVHNFTTARARHKTERLLRALPLEIQKDIGWPEAADSRITTMEVASANSLGILARHG